AFRTSGKALSMGFTGAMKLEGMAVERASEPPMAPLAASLPLPDAAADAQRLTRCVRAHLPVVWRMLRRHGVSAGDADAAAQRLFRVFARKLAPGSRENELAFLLRTAVFVASEARRSVRRRREAFDAEPDLRAAGQASPESALEQREAVAELDAILN